LPSIYSYNLTTAFILLYVSAIILKVNDIMPLICKDHTKDKPIRFEADGPIFATTETTPKYPADAIVITENKSVINPIHLDVIF
jgi:hypothetical protein